jgi:hypothetical protein
MGNIIGIMGKSEMKKAPKRSVLRLFLSWQWDSNRRPADYKSAGRRFESGWVYRKPRILNENGVLFFIGFLIFEKNGVFWDVNYFSFYFSF